MRTIRTDKDHAVVLNAIERLWGAGPGTPEGDTLDVLTVLVDDYENLREVVRTPTSANPL